jgi:hypothetical protein
VTKETKSLEDQEIKALKDEETAEAKPRQVAAVTKETKRRHERL